MKYRIYFEAFGRKLKTTVEADSESEAMHSIRNSIEILRVEKVGSDETVEMLKNMFGMNG